MYHLSLPVCISDTLPDLHYRSMNSQLLDAASIGNTSVVQRLISRRADVNIRDERNLGVTPLFLAAEKGHQEVVRLLLTKKANVNVVATDGYTPLLIAAETGHCGVSSPPAEG